MEGSNITQLISNLHKMADSKVKVQTCYATAVAVNWQDRTMTAKGVLDGLEFYNVSLGLGSVYRRPKVGAMCLIGLIENKDAASFLIDADAVEETVFNEGLNGGLIIIQKLVDALNQLEQKHNQLASQVEALPVPVSGQVSGPPVPGSYAGVKINALTQVSALVNEKVKH